MDYENETTTLSSSTDIDERQSFNNLFECDNSISCQNPNVNDDYSDDYLSPPYLNPCPAWLIIDEKGNKKVNEVVFCSEFTRNRKIRYIYGTFYDLNGEICEDKIAYEINKIMSKYIFTGIANRVKNVVGALRMCCYSSAINVCEDEIHLLNGVLKTNGAFIPEKLFCVNRLNIEYGMKTKPPEKFLSFLSDLLEPDDIITLQEYLGYLMIPSTKVQAMISIIGNGGEGKSVLGTVIKEIFGKSMVEGNFQRIETDRFFRANLKGKLIFLDDDLQLEALPSTGYVKSLITMQIPTDIEYKGKQSYSEKLYARFLCFGNGTVKSLYDKSAGFSRRMIILTTKHIPENRKINPNLAEEIIAEKNGVFNWMFMGLQRLLSNNYIFTISERTKRNLEEMKADNCNVIEFLNDINYIQFSEGVESSSTNLYIGYCNWCCENALTPLKRDSFLNWLKSNQDKYSISMSNHIKNDNGREVRGFKGINSKYRPIII